MEITISSDVFGLSSTKHLRRNAVLHPSHDVVMMWWLCHLISWWGVGLNTSDLTQRSGLITRIASDLCRAHQKYPCTVWSIIGLQQIETIKKDSLFNPEWTDSKIIEFAKAIMYCALKAFVPLPKRKNNEVKTINWTKLINPICTTSYVSLFLLIYQDWMKR